ncbi:unnamed protein product, partial [Ectocarpus sp. 12 AP-2014]
AKCRRKFVPASSAALEARVSPLLFPLLNTLTPPTLRPPSPPSSSLRQGNVPPGPTKRAPGCVSPAAVTFSGPPLRLESCLLVAVACATGGGAGLFASSVARPTAFPPAAEESAAVGETVVEFFTPLP